MPAKLIIMRFEKEIIEELQITEWWNLPATEIQQIRHVFNKELTNISDLSTFLK